MKDGHVCPSFFVANKFDTYHEWAIAPLPSRVLIELKATANVLNAKQVALFAWCEDHTSCI